MLVNVAICVERIIFAAITQKTMKKKLVFVTNNAHKIGEVRSLLDNLGQGLSEHYEICSLADIGCTDDIPETADTFSGNAFQKARYVQEHYGYDCFADDSGLEVFALDMAPGVRSARYASEEGHDSEANIRKLMSNMEGKRDRRARFRTVIALLIDGEAHEFEGICDGEITCQRAGVGGFGYDPVFRPAGYDLTFAEMSSDEKNSISHRGRAVKSLVEWLGAKC